jgi:hypothetical protein
MRKMLARFFFTSRLIKEGISPIQRMEFIVFLKNAGPIILRVQTAHRIPAFKSSNGTSQTA